MRSDAGPQPTQLPEDQWLLLTSLLCVRPSESTLYLKTQFAAWRGIQASSTPSVFPHVGLPGSLTCFFHSGGGLVAFHSTFLFSSSDFGNSSVGNWDMLEVGEGAHTLTLR